MQDLGQRFGWGTLHFVVMLSKALQRNVKHEARLSNISDYSAGTLSTK